MSATTHHGGNLTPAELNTRLMTATELAEHWSVARSHVYALMTDRGLPSVKIGGSRRFRLADVNSWLDAQQDGAA